MDTITSARVEEALYGEDSHTRDKARAELIRSGSTADLRRVVDALSASLDLTRRRATRLLSDIQPHRAQPIITTWLTQLSHREWVNPTGESTKSLHEGVAHAARLLNQLTVRGEREPALQLIFSSPFHKAQRAAICPACPAGLLADIVGGENNSLVDLALIECLRRLDRLTEESHLDRLDLSQSLRAKMSVERFAELKDSLQDDLAKLRLWVRLFAHLYPTEEERLNQANISLLDIETLTRCDMLSLYPHPRELIKHLCLTLTDASDHKFDPLALLIALERHQRDYGFLVAAELKPEIISALSTAANDEVRAITARLLPAGHPALVELITDQAPHVSWCAREAQRDRFSISQIQARLGEHQRLELPSATPPYGLRDFDEVPQVSRVHAALALCQARFDVNLGVAMRSAEAAGFREVFVVGARSGSLTSARGAEHAIPIRWLSDAQSLISIARAEGYQLVAVQQTPDSEPYHRATYPPQPLFILGSEDAGLPDELRVGADLAVEIPLYGVIDSLNVATAATCVMMHWRAHLSSS